MLKTGLSTRSELSRKGDVGFLSLEVLALDDGPALSTGPSTSAITFIAAKDSYKAVLATVYGRFWGWRPIR